MSLNDNREWVRQQHIVDRMQYANVLVVGDAMDDVYHFGRVERVCPEAPVPVFIPEKEETRPGGAANVAKQLRVLGCNVYEAFAPERSRKTRYMAGTHLLLRVDQDARFRAQRTDDYQIGQYLRNIPQLHAVVLSDYAKGWVTETMACTVISAATICKVPVIVDPKGIGWSKYGGCSLICPNEVEYRAESDAINNAGDAWGLEPGAGMRVLLKRGAKGMSLFKGDDSDVWHEIPATARHVYDVTGAGDTVVAVVAAAVATGATYLEAARLAALAAGYVVGEVGTATCSAEKLKQLLEENYNFDWAGLAALRKGGDAY